MDFIDRPQAVTTATLTSIAELQNPIEYVKSGLILLDRNACARITMRQTPMAVALEVHSLSCGAVGREIEDLHCAQTKDDAYGDLAPKGHLQVPGDDYGDRQHHQVCEEVDRGSRDVECALVNAFPV